MKFETGWPKEAARCIICRTVHRRSATAKLGRKWVGRIGVVVGSESSKKPVRSEGAYTARTRLVHNAYTTRTQLVQYTACTVNRV